MGHLTPDLLDFVRDWLPEPPVRVLELGCGDGALTRELQAAGYEATGVDPDAPAGEEFVRSTLEDFRTEERFDAAVAIRSLHHVHDLEAALSSLSAAIAPGSRFVLYEFAVESFDSSTERWLNGQGLEKAWGFEGVIPLGDLRQALGRRFRLLFEQPTAYFARELDREHLVALEESAISLKELVPAGMRLVYELDATKRA